MVSVVSLAANLVAALERASKEERERALALVRGAFPDESADCLRKRRQRDAERKRNVRGQSSDKPRNSEDLSADKGGGGDSLSPVSFSDFSPHSEQISKSDVAVAERAREQDEPAVPMSLTWELDNETRDAAKILGLRDVEGAWKAFRAENLDKPARTRRVWLAKFRDQWAPRARKYEQTDAGRGPTVRRPTLVVQPAGGAWKAGDGT